MSKGSSVVIKTDISEVMAQLDYFSTKDWINAEKRAVRAAGNKIRNKARRNFKSRLINATKPSEKYSDTLLDAIRVTKAYSNGQGDISVKVHGMGSRGKTSGTFRARFFNQGTKERHTKPYVDNLGRAYNKGHKLGKIKSLHFMDDAFTSVNDVAGTMEEILAAKIIQINKKKMK